MISFVAKKIFGTKNARVIKGMRPIVEHINSLEGRLQAMSDPELQGMTAEFRRRLDQGAKLDDLLPEAFAVCREAGRRILSMRHFDVQLMGGMVLHRGGIAEMKTGEGKTLVATLPVYLNALAGKGVHVITVNDYLARRDSEWMGRIYKFLGMSVGIVVHGLSDQERQESYRSDIAYGTNSEFGFDYLRDNMKLSIENYVQRDLNYAIVDEVDSILIDEARTPLIISGSAEQSADLYQKVDAIIPGLRKDIDYTVDEKAHSAILTDAGIERIEQRLGVGNLYNPANIEWLHHVTQALRAHTLYKRDVNYLIEDDKVIIVDEFTGRKMPGRRWSDGLHQAIEAKEGVEVQEENQTMATISYQNYFRIYKKLAGMTGTADTEAEEFHKIYKLDVTVVPTNKRHAAPGRARRRLQERARQVPRGRRRDRRLPPARPAGPGRHRQRREVGSRRVVAAQEGDPAQRPERQAAREGGARRRAGRAQGRRHHLDQHGGPRNGHHPGRQRRVHGARRDRSGERRQAGPRVAPGAGGGVQAGVRARSRPSATPRSRRSLTAGGLHILGTERHESRRIDNQLRGRAGRQGDPGSSRFYMSLEDDLMRIFAAERVTKIMECLGMEEDVPIEHPWINKAIEGAQKKVEGHNFDIRKNLLEYDDVMNQQRKTIYALRRQILEGRYAPEPTDEEKKQGKTAADQPVPTESGKHTAPSLAKTARPLLARMCEDLTEARAPIRTLPTASRSSRWSCSRSFLRSAIYRQFGAYPDPTGILEDRTATLDRLADEVGSSMIQQRERLLDLCEEILQGVVDESCPPHVHAEDWDLDALRAGTKERFNFEPTIDEGKIMERDALVEALWGDVEKVIDAREAELSLPGLLFYCRRFYLQEIDDRWIEHLKSMEALREGIGMRAYGQKDPKQEYKKEGFVIFGEMMRNIGRNVCEKVFHIQPEGTAQQPAQPQRRARRTVESGGGAEPRAASGDGQPAQEEGKTMRRDQPKVGRNDPCPCGSGKKYKKCHGAVATV